MGVNSLCGDHMGTHIHLRSDTTAVACIDRCGSTKPTNLLIEQIFNWAESREITLSAEYVKGVHNVEADKESRVQKLDTKWMLQPFKLSKLYQAFYTSDIDLFATRINAQLPIYISWKPDPDAPNNILMLLQ